MPQLALDLSTRTHWIFDMDGTLTVPQHDFRWLRGQLGIPLDQDILATIEQRSVGQAQADRAFIASYEDQLAATAVAQPDALELLCALVEQGCTLGILTRNTLPGATRTLASAGLAHFFPASTILGRDCATPKPDPAGVKRLLTAWDVDGSAAVVVGDWIHDIRAGARAGAASVLVRRHGPQPWEHEADLVVDDLRAVLSL